MGLWSAGKSVTSQVSLSSIDFNSSVIAFLQHSAFSASSKHVGFSSAKKQPRGYGSIYSVLSYKSCNDQHDDEASLFAVELDTLVVVIAIDLALRGEPLIIGDNAPACGEESF